MAQGGSRQDAACWWYGFIDHRQWFDIARYTYCTDDGQHTGQQEGAGERTGELHQEAGQGRTDNAEVLARKCMKPLTPPTRAAGTVSWMIAQ